MVELTEVMRQREECQFINSLNRFWESGIDEGKELTLNPRFFGNDELLYLESVVHIFTEKNSKAT